MVSVGHGGGADLTYDAFSVKHKSTEPDHWGEWACLAVTYDVAKREIVHYRNGERTGVGKFKYTEPQLLDYVELANYRVSRAELQRSEGLPQHRVRTTARSTKS